MSECNDKRFEEMLYAYELGMLSDDERTAVEMHQMECDHCFHMAKKFRESTRLIRSDPAVRKSIHQMAVTQTDTDGDRQTPEEPSTSKAKSWPTWIKTSIAVAAVLMLLILQPWKIEINPHQKALAGENTLAIMYFDNLDDPEDEQQLGDIIANLLITDISEADNVQVVSNQRLFDIRKMLGKDSLRVIDKNTAAEVARKADAKWMLTGNILQMEPSYIISSQLIDVASGNIVNSQRVDGDSADTIFDLVDRLSRKIMNDLPLPAGMTPQPDHMIADVTTHSEDAYRYYLEGIDYDNRAFYAEAIGSFERALNYDSTFAMVYYYLANLKDYRLIDKAVAYMDRATQKEKYYIESLQAGFSGNISMAVLILQRLVDRYPQEKRAYYLLGRYKYSLRQYDESIRYLSMAVELDPLYINGYNMLAYAYSQLGNLDKAIEMNDKCIFLSPNEPNPYDTRGDIYANHQMYDKAIESYKKALEKKSDFYSAWRNLGIMYTYRGEFLQAESCFQVIASVEDIYVWTDGKIYLVENLMYQGKFQEALSVLRVGSQEDKKAHGEERYSTYHHLSALIYEELGEFDSALKELNASFVILNRTNPNNRVYWRRYAVRILAASGDMAGAEEMTMQLKSALEVAGTKLGDYWYATGAIRMAMGEYDMAEADFRRATAESEEFDYSAHLMLGRALLELNRFDEAIDEFEKLVISQSSLPENWRLWDARIYYYLGIAYSEAGKPGRAAEQFNKYLEVRKNADSDVESVKDAAERLKKLIS